MTYFKTALVSAATLAIAAPAFADHHGDKKKDDNYKSKTTMTEQQPETEVRGAVEMNDVKINDTVGEILQADGEPSIQSDEDIIVMDDTVNENAFRAADDDGMVADNAIVVPGSNGTLSTVTCPAGTTAQADMTCLITGDYKPDITE